MINQQKLKMWLVKKNGSKKYNRVYSQDGEDKEWCARLAAVKWAEKYLWMDVALSKTRIITNVTVRDPKSKHEYSIVIHGCNNPHFVAIPVQKIDPLKSWLFIGDDLKKTKVSYNKIKNKSS